MKRSEMIKVIENTIKENFWSHKTGSEILQAIERGGMLSPPTDGQKECKKNEFTGIDLLKLEEEDE